MTFISKTCVNISVCNVGILIIYPSYLLPKAQLFNFHVKQTVCIKLPLRIKERL